VPVHDEVVAPAEVQDAVMDTAAALAAEHGPASVTMSQVAEQAGITAPRSTSTSPT
jgi:AcrR family transcriptional regulator